MKKIMLISAAALCAAMMWSCNKSKDIQVMGFDVTEVQYDPDVTYWSGSNAKTISEDKIDKCNKATQVIVDAIVQEMCNAHFSSIDLIKEQFERHMTQLQTELDNLGFTGEESNQSICTPHIVLTVRATATGDETPIYSSISRKEYVSDFSGISYEDVSPLRDEIDKVINEKFPLNQEGETAKGGLKDAISEVCKKFEDGVKAQGIAISGEYVLFPTMTNDRDTTVTGSGLTYEFGK